MYDDVTQSRIRIGDPECAVPAQKRGADLLPTRRAHVKYRSDGRFGPVVLCCAVVRRKSASLRLVSMRSDTILPQ
jgi:hypothetical protein